MGEVSFFAGNVEEDDYWKDGRLVTSHPFVFFSLFFFFFFTSLVSLVVYIVIIGEKRRKEKKSLFSYESLSKKEIDLVSVEQ